MSNCFKEHRHLRYLVISFVLMISFGIGLYASAVNYGTELENAPIKQYEQKFSDVNKDYWAFSYIGEMVNRSVINGYPDGKFRPDDMVTRAEFAKIIVTAAGLKASKTGQTSYADVQPTDWCNPYIETAKNYLTGFRDPAGNYIYKPDTPALREDIAVAIVKIKGYDTKIADRSLIQKMFSDYSSISEAVIDYVAVAVEKELISGYPDGTFRGQDSITRAEAATLLWRAYQYGNANKEVDTTDVTPTPEMSSTDDPYGISATPTPSPSPVPKYSVTTLFGGNGTGSADGSVITAQINTIDSMVSDKNGNIYFIDSGKIRKYTKASKSVETYLTIDDRFTINDDTNGVLEYTNFKPETLCYDYYNNALLLSGRYRYGMDYDIALFVIYPTIKYIALTNGLNATSCLSMALSEDGVLMLTADGYYRVTVGNSQLIASTSDGYFLASSYNAFSVSYWRGTLFASGSNNFWYNQIYPPKYSKLKDVYCDASTSQNGAFYYSKGDTFHKMTLDSKSTAIITSKDLNYDGNPIRSLNKMFFDYSGNLICYDKGNNAVYSISMLDFVQPPEVVKCEMNPTAASTPTPTPTPSPTSTPTPEPTATPTPTATPIPTATPSATPEAVPTTSATPTSSSTPNPTPHHL